MSQNLENVNSDARRAWDTNAEFWDQTMGEGNNFFMTLLWPAVEKLLYPVVGERILDAACRNGLTSRRLVEAGANVTAFDFSEAMISQARQRGESSQIQYHVLDATNREALMSLGAGAFDGVLCNMALMDMAEITTFMKVVYDLLRPDGRFVFSVLHPCFNNPSIVQMSELEDRAGTLVTTYSVKVSRYLTPYVQLGLAMHNQPVPQPYFHRPLSALLITAFQSGFVLDAIEERAFPPAEHGSGTAPLSWSGCFSEIPPALVVRLRKYNT